MMTTWRMGRQNAARWRRTVDFVGGWMVERTRTNDAAAGRMARHGGGRADRSTWQGQEKKTQNYSSRGRLRLCVGYQAFPTRTKHTHHTCSPSMSVIRQKMAPKPRHRNHPAHLQEGKKRKIWWIFFTGVNGWTDGRKVLTRILTRGVAGSRRRTTHRPPVTLGNEEWG